MSILENDKKILILKLYDSKKIKYLYKVLESDNPLIEHDPLNELYRITEILKQWSQSFNGETIVSSSFDRHLDLLLYLNEVSKISLEDLKFLESLNFAPFEHVFKLYGENQSTIYQTISFMISNVVYSFKEQEENT